MCNAFRSARVTLDPLRMCSKKYVVETVAEQHPEEIILAQHLTDKDFAHILQMEINPFLENYRPDVQLRSPVTVIGPQVWY